MAVPKNAVLEIMVSLEAPHPSHALLTAASICEDIGRRWRAEHYIRVNSPCPVSPLAKRNPDSPWAWPPRWSLVWGWAATDRRTRRRCWSSGSRRSNAESCAAGLRTDLHERGDGSCQWFPSTGLYKKSDRTCFAHPLSCCHLAPGASSTSLQIPLKAWLGGWGGRGGGYVETKQSENLAVVIKGAGAVITLCIPITQLRWVHA